MGVLLSTAPASAEPTIESEKRVRVSKDEQALVFVHDKAVVVVEHLDRPGEERWSFRVLDADLKVVQVHRLDPARGLNVRGAYLGEDSVVVELGASDAYTRLVVVPIDGSTPEVLTIHPDEAAGRTATERAANATQDVMAGLDIDRASFQPVATPWRFEQPTGRPALPASDVSSALGSPWRAMHFHGSLESGWEAWVCRRRRNLRRRPAAICMIQPGGPTQVIELDDIAGWREARTTRRQQLRLRAVPLSEGQEALVVHAVGVVSGVDGNDSLVSSHVSVLSFDDFGVLEGSWSARVATMTPPAVRGGADLKLALVSTPDLTMLHHDGSKVVSKSSRLVDRPRPRGQDGTRFLADGTLVAWAQEKRDNGGHELRLIRVRADP